MTSDAAHPVPDAAPLEVLVVDDDPDLASGLARILKMEGHAVRTATNGFQALDLAKERRPTVVLVDMKMPGMNGFELVRLLRPGGPALTVVYMTGYSEMAHLAGEEGATVLTKPFDHQQLVALLATVRQSRTSS